MTSNVQAFSWIPVTKKTYWIFKDWHQIETQKLILDGNKRKANTYIFENSWAQNIWIFKNWYQIETQKKLGKKLGNYTNTWAFEKMEMVRQELHQI